MDNFMGIQPFFIPRGKRLGVGGHLYFQWFCYSLNLGRIPEQS